MATSGQDPDVRLRRRAGKRNKIIIMGMAVRCRPGQFTSSRYSPAGFFEVPLRAVHRRPVTLGYPWADCAGRQVVPWIVPRPL